MACFVAQGEWDVLQLVRRAELALDEFHAT
jgi:hypothetical protein